MGGCSNSRFFSPGTESNHTPTPPRVAMDTDEVMIYEICNETEKVLTLFEGVQIGKKECLSTSKASRYNLYRLMIEYKYKVKWKAVLTPAKVTILILNAELKKRESQ